MADIRINELETLSPSGIDGSYYGMVFTSDGDTNKVVFDDAVAQSNANNGCLCVKKASFTIAAADVLNLHSTPQYFLPPLGADIYPDFINITLEFTNGTTPYDTNVDAEIKFFGADEPIFESATILNSDGWNRSFVKSDPTYVSGDKQVVANVGTYIWSPTGAPATGDYDIIVHATYVEVDIS